MTTTTQRNNQSTNPALPFAHGTTHIETSACAFLLCHRDEHLGTTDGLLKLRQRCAQHLMAVHSIAYDRALECAARMLAEITHTGDAWIDIDASTSFSLVLRVNGQHNVSFTADQLLEAVKNYYKLAV